MSKLTKIAFAACAWAGTAMSSAVAADLLPPPVYPHVPVSPVVMSGWYLRGDIGYSNQRVDELDNALYDFYDEVDTVDKDFTGAPLAAAGVGFRFNKWFRADVTGEHRSKSEFNGADIGYVDGFIIPDNYSAKKSEWLGMVNAYIDLGSWHGISPFIGAGVGAVNVEIRTLSISG